MSTELKDGFAKGLRLARSVRELSQEAFSDVSSRTYLSTLERGMKSPTLDKLEDLASVLEIHPLTLLTLAYVTKKGDVKNLQRMVDAEVKELFDAKKLLDSKKLLKTKE